MTPGHARNVQRHALLLFSTHRHLLSSFCQYHLLARLLARSDAHSGLHMHALIARQPHPAFSAQSCRPLSQFLGQPTYDVADLKTIWRARGDSIPRPSELGNRVRKSIAFRLTLARTKTVRNHQKRKGGTDERRIKRKQESPLATKREKQAYV